jgi:hypothetical protein
MDWKFIEDDGLPTKPFSNNGKEPAEYLCYCNDIVDGWFHKLWYDDHAWLEIPSGEEVPFIITHWVEITKP